MHENDSQRAVGILDYDVPRVSVGLQLEVVALRHQLTVYQRTTLRPRIQPADRMFWSWLSRWWSAWRSARVFAQPGTVITWQRKRFRGHWAKLSGRGGRGRQTASKEIRALIRRISVANPSWGSSRVVGELLSEVGGLHHHYERLAA